MESNVLMFSPFSNVGSLFNRGSCGENRIMKWGIKSIFNKAIK